MYGLAVRQLQFVRAMVIIAGACLVVPGVVALVLVKVGRDVANGLPIDATDLATIAAFGGGGAIVLGISGRALWRERKSVGWAIYGVLLAVAALVGTVVGAGVGWNIANERIADLHEEAARTCEGFLRSHPGSEEECERRAIDCRGRVIDHPPVAQRGLGGAAPPVDEGAPTELRARAIWECMGGH